MTIINNLFRFKKPILQNKTIVKLKVTNENY